MDRITQITIKNVRAIESLTLDLSRSVTVLIGENGSCKSTVIECCELLRKASEPNFLQEFYSTHRAMPGLLRKGATSLEMAVLVQDDTDQLPTLQYQFALASSNGYARVDTERLTVQPLREPSGVHKAFLRRESGCEVWDVETERLLAIPAAEVRPDQLLLSSLGRYSPQPSLNRMLTALNGIEVHLPFETIASWAARTYQRPEGVRAAATHLPASRLGLLGGNLPNAWSELKNRDQAHWDFTMELVRLGLGDRVDNVVVTPDPGGGNVYLGLRFEDLPEPVMAGNLSDGQLAWLGWVAMTRLNAGRSLLAVDEPELHLHPALLGRVISLLSNLDGGAPVILTTHSDRVIEMLDDPVDAVRVCSLEGNRAVVSRIDSENNLRRRQQFEHLGQTRVKIGSLTCQFA